MQRPHLDISSNSSKTSFKHEKSYVKTCVSKGSSASLWRQMCPGRR